MARLIFASVFLLFSSIFTVGQDVAELAIIRGLLGVPQNTPVTFGRSATIAKEAPLKVYLDVSGDAPERDKTVKDGLVQWLSELGKSETIRRTNIELVSEPGAASVALIQFTDFPIETEDPGQDERGQPGGLTSYSSTVKMTMTVYTYIVVRELINLKIVYRRRDQLLSRSTIVAGPQLNNTVKIKLRKEIDKEIDKRRLKSRDVNDTKRPDYKLRDEFVKWMSADVSSLKTQ